MERCEHKVLDRDKGKGHVPAERSCLRTNVLYDIATGLQAVLYSLYKLEALDRTRVDKSLIINSLGE
jgi:hypothetical protein